MTTKRYGTYALTTNQNFDTLEFALQTKEGVYNATFVVVGDETHEWDYEYGMSNGHVVENVESWVEDVNLWTEDGNTRLPVPLEAREVLEAHAQENLLPSYEGGYDVWAEGVYEVAGV